MTTGAEWMGQARRLVDTFLAGAATAPAGADDAHDTCRWCLLCQAAAVARGERPEVSTALAEVLTATAGALRTFAEGAAAQPAPPAQPGPTSDTEPGPAVQRIDIA